MARTDGLLDEPRSGAPRRIGDEQVAELNDRTLSERPQGGSHWSQLSMAKASGMSGTTVGRVWRAFGLQLTLTHQTGPRLSASFWGILSPEGGGCHASQTLHE